MGVLKDAVGDDAGTRSSPILWVDRPQNCRQGPRGMKACVLAAGKCAVGRAKSDRWATGDLKDGIRGAVNFAGDGRCAQAIQKRMCVAVIANLVAFFGDAPRDFRVLHHAVANQIERGANVAFAQHIEKARRVGGVWPIIKRHGNHGRRCADGGYRRRIRVDDVVWQGNQRPRRGLCAAHCSGACAKTSRQCVAARK